MTTANSPEHNPTIQRYLWIRRAAVVGGLLVITLAIFVAALLLQPSLRKKVRDLEFAVRHPFATYDDKMRLQLGITYDYLVFIRAHTPESAVIMVPPRTYSPPHLGDPVMVRYFIYPRTAVHQDQAGRATYAMLVPGWTPGGILITVPITRSWGLIDLAAGQVTWMNTESSQP